MGACPVGANRSPRPRPAPGDSGAGFLSPPLNPDESPPMRHRMRGRKLGRNASHRKAMFKNMASSLIKSVRPDPDDPDAAKVPGRIVTTTPKAKELRPYVEKLITMGKKARVHAAAAEPHATKAEKGSADYRTWREGEGWRSWNQARAPYVALRRRAFSILRDDEAVDVLFEELAERFESRPGGYTRVIRLAARRLGDGGEQALIEFVGENDARTRSGKRRTAPTVRNDAPVVRDDAPAAGGDEPADPTVAAETDAAGPPARGPRDRRGRCRRRRRGRRTADQPPGLSAPVKAGPWSRDRQGASLAARTR